MATDLLPLTLAPVTLSLAIYATLTLMAGTVRYLIATTLFIAMLVAAALTVWYSPSAIAILSPIWAGAFALAVLSLSWSSARHIQ